MNIIYKDSLPDLIIVGKKTNLYETTYFKSYQHLFFTNFLLISNAFSDNVHIKALSYVFAPLQIADNEKKPGYATEIVRELVARTVKSQPNTFSEFKILPFKSVTCQ